jgi:hypothetical protein
VHPLVYSVEGVIDLKEEPESVGDEMMKRRTLLKKNIF